MLCLMIVSCCWCCCTDANHFLESPECVTSHRARGCFLSNNSKFASKVLKMASQWSESKSFRLCATFNPARDNANAAAVVPVFDKPTPMTFR